jgi:hypothetical protein
MIQPGKQRRRTQELRINGESEEGIDQTYGGCKRTPNLLCFILH